MNTPWEILAGAIARLTDRIDALPTVREATVFAVTSTYTQVKFDTDTTPTTVHGTLAGNLMEGQRVLTLKLRHYVWILGIRNGVPDTGWITVTSFLNGFSAGSAAPQYRRIGNVVHLRGDVFRATAPGVGGAVIAFNLPPGFRPSLRWWIATIIWDTRIHGQENGDVGVYASQPRTSSPGYSMSAISYTID